MAHTQVLLREDIDNLGARGEIVRVKTGYARNYLLPRNLAVEATANNVRQIVLREPIKRFGNYSVPVRLHRDVTVELPISVLGEGGVEVDVEALQGEGASPEAPVEAAQESNEAEESGAE